MRKDRKRVLSAWLLLLVFVPTMVMVSLHRHCEDISSTMVECEQCVHHVHHSGHFGVQQASIHDCLVCQFASLPFLFASTVAVGTMATLTNILRHADTPWLRRGVWDALSARAPPANFPAVILS